MQKSIEDDFISERKSKSYESYNERFLMKTQFRPETDKLYNFKKPYDKRMWEKKLEEPFPDIVLERYNTKALAMLGHQKWLKIIQNNPEDKRIKDCRNSCEVFLLLPKDRYLLLKEPKITKKGIYYYRIKAEKPDVWLRTIINRKVEITESIIDMKKATIVEGFPKNIPEDSEKKPVDIIMTEDTGNYIIDTSLSPYTKI